MTVWAPGRGGEERKVCALSREPFASTKLFCRQRRQRVGKLRLGKAGRLVQGRGFQGRLSTRLARTLCSVQPKAVS